MEALAMRLQAVARNNPEIRVFVRGDQAIDYGRVMAVVGAIHNAGISKVALLTQPVQTSAATTPR
jgi:biopolymer transport protein TolR